MKKDKTGLNLCTRYAFPPNSLSLCGPERQKDLKYYSLSQNPDSQTKEILEQFSTLYPYLQFVAKENNLKNPFLAKVVEAYWLGNDLLQNINIREFSRFLRDDLGLRKKLNSKKLNQLLPKLISGGLPHHSFHVVNVYKRTGNIDSPHTLETMDACLINWGKIVKILPSSLVVKTRKLKFNKLILRKISISGAKDNLQVGDYVSYHWGRFCQKLNLRQLQNLIYYTNLSLNLANQNI